MRSSRIITIELLSFKGHSSSASQITGASIGPKKAGSDPWDFTSSATNITFNGGSDSGTLPAGGTLVSDEIDFTFDGNTDYLVAIYSTDGDMGYLDMSGAAYRRDGLGADDSMTVDPAMAYEPEPYIEWLAKIEVYTESGGGGGGEKYFFHADYLGSVRMISDVSGEVVWQKRYTPFGGDEEQSGTLQNTYQFTGKGWDADAGLFYFNARWYDPEVGRFISEDPLWGNILDPQSLNRFAYGRNNPFRYKDPSGKTHITITITRTDENEERTFGSIEVGNSSNDDKIEGLHSLELPDNNNKNDTSRINADTYPGERDLNSKEKDVIKLEDAHGRTGIQIEVGNSVQDTEGCILVGSEREGDRLKDSKKAMDEIIDFIDDIIGMDNQNGEDTTIDVNIEENF